MKMAQNSRDSVATISDGIGEKYKNNCIAIYIAVIILGVATLSKYLV